MYHELQRLVALFAASKTEDKKLRGENQGKESREKVSRQTDIDIQIYGACTIGI